MKLIGEYVAENIEIADALTTDIEKYRAISLRNV